MTKQDFILAALRQTLTQEQVNWLFTQPEADVRMVLVNLAKRNDWAGFTSDFEQKIDNLCNSNQAWVWYMQYYICTINTETNPWTIRNLSPSAQIRVLGLSGITYLIGEYAKHHYFCERALETLFENKQYFNAYVSYRKLDKTGFIKMLTSLDKEELLKIYICRYKLSEKNELEMVKRISALSPVLEEYMTTHMLSPKVQNLLLLQLMQELRKLKKQVVSKVPVKLG